MVSSMATSSSHASYVYTGRACTFVTDLWFLVFSTPENYTWRVSRTGTTLRCKMERSPCKRLARDHELSNS